VHAHERQQRQGSRRARPARLPTREIMGEARKSKVGNEVDDGKAKV